MRFLGVLLATPASAALLAAHHDVDRSVVDARLKKTEGLYELMRKSSHAQEASEFERKYADVRATAEKRMKTMSHTEALDTLKKQMGSDKHSEISSLLQKGAKADNKSLYVSAMKSLNEMFLSVDDARITTQTECVVTLSQRFNQLGIYADTIRNFEMEIGEASTAAYLANQQKEKTEGDIELKNKEAEGLAAEQSTDMGNENKELEGMEAEVSTFRFIMSQVEKQCPLDAEGTNKKHLKLLASGRKQQEGSEKCLSEESAQASANSAMLKIFSAPGVMEAADRELDATSAHSLKDTVRNLEAAEREEIHAVYKGELSFLQKRSDPDVAGAAGAASGGDMARDPMAESAEGQLVGEMSSGGAFDLGCGCGAAGLDCPALYTIVGQELECRKNKKKNQEAYIKQLEDQHNKARDEMNRQVTALNKLKEGFETQIENYNNEAKAYHEPKWKNILDMEEFFHNTKDARFSCYLKLFELESNEYCATKHLREYMKAQALGAFQLNEDDVQDCEYADKLRAEAYCFAPGDTAKHVKCLQGDTVPANDDLLPKQQWSRDSITPQFQTEVAWKAFNNETIALGCPKTEFMHLTCNAFLCPKHCSVSDWSSWAECTAECDKGMEQRSRDVVHMPLNGGNSCPPLQESRPCNLQKCNEPCELHEAFLDEADVFNDKHHTCLSACSGTDEEGQPEQRYKIMQRPMFKAAVGNGGCPKMEDEGIRTRAEPCTSYYGEDRRCSGDEICGDTMDLVIAYECSASVTRLGCWFMATFVVSLLERMPTIGFLMPKLKIGLVKFGNGISKTNDGGATYYVNQAKRMSWLTTENRRMRPRILNDIISVFHGKSNYRLGFTNIGSAVKQAGTILDRSWRTEGNSDQVAKQKILILTKGKRAECTPLKTVADGLKKKGITLDIVLFSSTYKNSPDAAAKTLQDSVTYPYRFHLHNPGALSKLNDFTWRSNAAGKLIPKICPGAFSMQQFFWGSCNKGEQIVHRGRTCPDWTYALAKKPITLSKCRNKAHDKGYKGFVWTDPNSTPGMTEPNCFTHKIFGKLAQVDEEDKPKDDTCHYVPDYAPKGNATAMEEYTGWEGQALPAGEADATSHYRVLEGASACRGSHYRWLTQLLAGYSWGDYRWFHFYRRHGSYR